MKHLQSIISGSVSLILVLAVGSVNTCSGREPAKAEIAVLSKTAESLQQEHIKDMQEKFNGRAEYRRMQNAVTMNPINELAMNREIFAGMTETFSHKLDDWAVTNQKRTGRCWMFAGMNLLRVGAMKKMNLKNFEFSQSYIFFWDKIERSNYFLESIIDTAERPDGDRTVDCILADSLGDGGQWSMFVSLIKKYGLVPKVAMPESNSSSNSKMMNKILRAKLHEGAKRLRDMHSQGATISRLRSAKREILTVIYRILSIHMGTPPEKFDWQWRDKDDEFHRDGTLTPQEFAGKYLSLDLDEYVCLVHDPRPNSPIGRTFTVAYLGNVVGSEPIKYLNVDIKLIKEITMRTLLDGEPVWFGCDVSKQMDRDLGLWDNNLFDYEGIYDTRFTLQKADRLIYHQSRMTHAMLLTGVDVVDGKPRRWRVENSWGEDVGKKGFFIMNDSWFDEYVFEIGARKSYLPENLRKAWEQEPIIFPPWDPMGSLARQEILLDSRS
ncbi:MAG: C1 family peptidase [Sedimentisphaerales bacterium]|nr:C1 family peptidase [Sedimentisphaerales bacterium]